MNRLSSLESTFENGFNQNSGCCIGRMARNMRCFPVDCRIHLFVRNLSIANRFIFELYRFGTIGLLSSTITKACRQGAIIVAFKTMRIVKLNRKESKANQPRWLLNHFTSKECPVQMKLNQTNSTWRKSSKSEIGDTPNKPFHAGDLTKWSPHIQEEKSASEGAESPTLHLLLVKTQQVRRAIPFDDLKKKQASYRVQRRNKIPSKRLIS